MYKHQPIFERKQIVEMNQHAQILRYGNGSRKVDAVSQAQSEINAIEERQGIVDYGKLRHDLTPIVKHGHNPRR